MWLLPPRRAMGNTEPSAASLRLFDNRFSPQYLATMLPKVNPGPAKIVADRMTQLLTVDLPGATTQAALTDFLLEAEDLAATAVGNASSEEVRERTLRLDISIRPPGSSEHIWVDVTTRHCSAAAYRGSSLKFFRKELMNELAAKHNGGGNAMHQEISPQLVNASRLKHRKYSPLLTLTELQRKRHLMPSRRKPLFLSPTVAHHANSPE